MRPIVTAGCLLLLLLPGTCVRAQFFLNGSAVQTSDSCFRLTPADINQVGSIWFPEKVDLRNSFDLVMTMNFGCLDGSGADGIAFALQPISANIGSSGGGLGIEGVRPALAVEFDTWQNDIYSDPVFDHVAIMANGTVRHQGPGNLAGPVRASAVSDNIERCDFLPLRVTWNAGRQLLSVWFDCELRLEYAGDIVNDIFGGDPFVFYGFAAATGGAVNEHSVCFTFNSFLRQLEDVTMCPGGQVLLDATGGTRYEWSPAAGLSDPTIGNPVASPDTTTVYTVRIFDDCGLPLLDTVRITVAGDSAFVDLGPDTLFCRGQGLPVDVTTPTATYAWSDPGLSGPVELLTQAGTYAVTVTRTDVVCEASDRVTIELYPDPEFELGPPDTSICPGDTVWIDSGPVAPFAELADGTRFNRLPLTRQGRYRAWVDDPCGTISDQLDLYIRSCNEVFLPNAFSPNGDGVNDAFFPQDGGDVLMVHSFRIYERWGGEVFSATNIGSNRAELGWDGELNGRPAPVGVYLWVMDASFLVGTREVRRGAVNLVR